MADKNPREVAKHRRTQILTRRDAMGLLLRVAVIMLGVWLLLTQVFLITRCQGTDMFPAVKDGDLIIAYRLQESYGKDDVIVYAADGRLYTGRIAAMGGDVVAMDETGTLLVNGGVQSGQILYPTYAKEGVEYPYSVPEGSVFLLGDYRTHARDSRDFGAVSLENVEGKVITILRRRGI